MEPVLLVALPCAVGAAAIAGAKRRAWGWYLLLGLFLGPLMLLIAIFMPTHPPRYRRLRQRRQEKVFWARERAAAKLVRKARRDARRTRVARRHRFSR